MVYARTLVLDYTIAVMMIPNSLKNTILVYIEQNGMCQKNFGAGLYHSCYDEFTY